MEICCTSAQECCEEERRRLGAAGPDWRPIGADYQEEALEPGTPSSPVSALSDSVSSAADEVY